MSSAITPLASITTPQQALDRDLRSAMRELLRDSQVACISEIESALELAEKVGVSEYLDSLGRCDCANNLIALRGGRAGCIHCGGDVAIGKQIWQCYGCGTCRVWGLEWPLDFSTPRLNCIACARVMPHRFMLVTRKQCK